MITTLDARRSGSVGVKSTHKFNGPVKLIPILAIPEECNFYKQLFKLCYDVSPF